MNFFLLLGGGAEALSASPQAPYAYAVTDDLKTTIWRQTNHEARAFENEANKTLTPTLQAPIHRMVV